MFKIKAAIPSGKVYYINELKNESYFAANKFILNEDYFGFYQSLDDHIRLTVPNIDSINLLDKLYLYIILFATCVKGTIPIPAESIIDFENPPVIELFSVLESLSEINVVPKQYTIDTTLGQATLEIFYPTKLEDINNTVIFDPISAIRTCSLNGTIYTVENKEDRELLNALIPVDSYYQLIQFIIDNFNTIIVFYKGRLELPILSQYFFKYFANNIFYGGLQYQFDLMYLLQRHLNVSISDFKNMSPADSEMLFAKLVKEKEEEKKSMEKENNQEKEFVF